MKLLLRLVLRKKLMYAYQHMMTPIPSSPCEIFFPLTRHDYQKIISLLIIVYSQSMHVRRKRIWWKHMYITIMKMVLGADKNAFLEDEVGTRLYFSQLKILSVGFFTIVAPLSLQESWLYFNPLLEKTETLLQIIFVVVYSQSSPIMSLELFIFSV